MIEPMTATDPGPGHHIVNVASVPQRSPFRYPGGKTWLVPHIRRWLRHQPCAVGELVEPFAGGGIVSLTAVFEDLAERATLIELDEDMAAVWRTILNGHGTQLARDIVALDLSPDSVRLAIAASSASLYQRALATIIRNRVSRGGILAPGAGLIKYGENGKGLRSRWYPETISRRILEITQRKDRIHFIHGDGMAYMKLNAHRQDAVYFIDPPYTVAGRRLYVHSDVDHAALFDAVASLRGDFLMTYDNAAEIRDLARMHGFDTRLVPMKSTHHECKMELLVGRSLRWVDG